ncbi:hypothetical protein [Cupriavidus plantarum]|uniref:hypothetical protein n=1 Tax=Cupriavidus plantarum TaxID=942865 RepID=UPI000E24DC05|nr:hypothetical protein [Cupriavidus plantarum]REE92597.1 hypothetical protein C7418_3865 [Cupriavidus plantarum]CAG2150354.1 hypothetical protein LMG26296_04714 [Cupriavidus plantarum]SMR67963.1 hypothetical protein SAMN05421735_2871 [Cupriavidus plantarum]
MKRFALIPALVPAFLLALAASPAFAKAGQFDVYTDGAKAGQFDVFTDGMRGQFDVFTDGAAR